MRDEDSCIRCVMWKTYTARAKSRPTEGTEVYLLGTPEVWEERGELRLRVGRNSFRLGDIAQVTRGLEDPPAGKTRYQGRSSLAERRCGALWSGTGFSIPAASGPFRPSRRWSP